MVRRELTCLCEECFSMHSLPAACDCVAAVTGAYDVIDIIPRSSPINDVTGGFSSEEISTAECYCGSKQRELTL